MAKLIGVHVPDGIKNYIINGDMRISQRGTSFAAAATSTYSTDRWLYVKNATSAVHTISQDTDVPGLAQAGYLFQNCLRMNLTTQDTSIGVSEFAIMQHRIEGYNWVNLAQKAFTISFWVKATLPGIYCVSLSNTGGDKSYVAEYTITGSNVWQYVVVTVPPSPSAGTWNYTNGTGVQLMFVLACGSNFQTTAGSWQSGQFFCTANQVNGVVSTSTSADFRITGIMVNEGPIAMPFRLFGGDITGEEIACKRYYEKSYDMTTNPATATVSGVVEVRAQPSHQETIRFTVRKRAQPTTVTLYNPSTGATGSWRDASNAVDRTFTVAITAESAFTATNAGTTVDNTTLQGHYTCDAEIP